MLRCKLNDETDSITDDFIGNVYMFNENKQKIPTDTFGLIVMDEGHVIQVKLISSVIFVDFVKKKQNKTNKQTKKKQYKFFPKDFRFLNNFKTKSLYHCRTINSRC